MPRPPLRHAGAIVLALAAFGVSREARAQEPPCSPYVQPLPPNYGAPQYAPKPCAGPAYAQPQYGNPPPQYGYPPQQAQPGYQVQPPPQQPACNAGCGSGVSDDDDDVDVYWSIFWDILALRVGSYDIRGSDADKKTWGFLVALDPDIALTAGYLSYRSTFYAAIGGGSDGLEGQLTWRSRVGVRGYVGEDHGPFARIGYGLEFLGNNKLYRSWIDLPYGEVGYQLLNEDIWFELGASGGLVLGGRYYTGDHAERRIDTEPELGGQFTLQTDGFRAHVSAMRIFAQQTGPGTPIDEANAELCLNPTGALLLCAHGAFHRGDVELPNGRFSESTATYFGATIGLGMIENGARSVD